MQIKKQLVKREISGDTILVPIGKTVYESNGLFILNELGAFLWDRLENAANAEELCDAVLSEYDVSREEASQDIQEFLDKLVSMGIL